MTAAGCGIIDIHTHAHMAEPAIADAMLRTAAGHGIVRVCLLGDVGAGGADPDEKTVRRINDQTIVLAGKHPDFFTGFMYLNPRHGRTFNRQESARCLAAGLSGIKLWIAVNARSRKLDHIMRFAGEAGIPVLHHAWYKTGGNLKHESTPADIADLAARFPQVTIIMAHLTGAGTRGVQDIRPYRNILIDTSGGQPVSGLVEYAVAELGAERVIYGSDIPYRDFACQIGRVRGACITEKQKRMILYENAVRLLRHAATRPLTLDA